MTELAVLLPLAAFLALAIGFAIVLQRAGRIVARTREIDQFRTVVRDLAARVDGSLEGAAGRIDAVRRGQLAADAIGPTLVAATDAVTRYAEEARAVSAPAAAAHIREELIRDLERAERALAMVEHGTKILAQARRRGREVEAQTAVKRGYLNLVHAREAVVRHAAAVEDLDATSTDRPVEPSAPGA